MITFDEDELQKRIDDTQNMVEEDAKLFKCKPTELRHTVGRLGEYKALSLLGGALAAKTNQPGWDLIDKNGRKVSVKTTAAVLYDSYISMNPNTINDADDLILIHYVDKKLEVLYHGPMKHILDTVAYSPGKSVEVYRLSRDNAMKAARTLCACQAPKLDRW